MQPTKEQEQEFNRMQETVQAIMQTLPPDTSEPERRITKIKARRIDDAEEITMHKFHIWVFTLYIIGIEAILITLTAILWLIIHAQK